MQIKTKIKTILSIIYGIGTLLGTVGTLSLALLSLLSSCGPRGNKPNVELIKDMMESPSVKSQEKDSFNNKRRRMGAPPPNTVPVGFRPYPYKGKPEVAGRKLKNPLKGKFSPSVLEEGKEYFRIYCQICHGEKGGGDGPVSGKFPKGMIKSLLTSKVINWPDGRIYHIISDGQGMMSSYAAQVPQKKRWALVQYIRFLQKQGNGKSEKNDNKSGNKNEQNEKRKAGP